MQKNLISSLKEPCKDFILSQVKPGYNHIFSPLVFFVSQDRLNREFGPVPTLFFSYAVLFYFDVQQSAKIQPEEQYTHFF